MVEEFWFDGSAGQPADGIQQPEELQQTTTEWTYDSLGRLVDEAIDHWDDNFDQTESYTYDLTGNRTKVARLSEAVPNPTSLTDADYDQTTAYTYDANDRLIEEVLDDLVDDNNDTTTTYGYDHTQQTSKTTHSGLPGQLGSVRSEQSFTYNLQGRMSSAVLETFDSSGALQTRQRSSYEYDRQSFRVGQLLENWNATTSQFEFASDTEFLVTHQNHTGYAQTLREATTNADGSTKTVDYTFGHDELTQTVTENGETTTHVFGHDGHGSVRVLYDLAATGSSLIEAVATYSSYGVLLDSHASDGTLSPVAFDLLTSLTYSGEAWDSVLNRGYNRARWYDASSAQWNRLDPFAGNMHDPQSLHKYAYVHGDPIQGIDPTGMFNSVQSLGTLNVTSFMRGVQVMTVQGVSRQTLPRLGNKFLWKAARTFAQDYYISNHIDRTLDSLARYAVTLEDLGLSWTQPYIERLQLIVKTYRGLKYIGTVVGVETAILPMMERFPFGRNAHRIRGFARWYDSRLPVRRQKALGVASLAGFMAMPIVLTSINSASYAAGSNLYLRSENQIASPASMFLKLLAGSALGSGYGFGGYRSVWMPDIIDKSINMVERQGIGRAERARQSIEALIRNFDDAFGRDVSVGDLNDDGFSQ